MVYCTKNNVIYMILHINSHTVNLNKVLIDIQCYFH